MKSIILSAILALAFVAGANAMNSKSIFPVSFNNDQNPGVTAALERAGDSLYTLNQLQNQLALTSDQVPVVDSILNSASQQLNASTDPMQKQQIINNANSAIENILTADQRSKFDAMKSQSNSTGY